MMAFYRLFGIVQGFMTATVSVLSQIALWCLKKDSFSLIYKFCHNALARLISRLNVTNLNAFLKWAGTISILTIKV